MMDSYPLLVRQEVGGPVSEALVVLQKVLEVSQEGVEEEVC